MKPSTKILIGESLLWAVLLALMIVAMAVTP